MNSVQTLASPAILLAGAAHLDRRGRCAQTFQAGASNPGRMLETVGGAAFNAARALRALDASVQLVSARGGDSTGDIVAAALEALGIGDLALTWLDRQTPTYTAILDANGDLVGGLADMALYDLMRHRVFQRRHIREALAAADALIVDANLPEPSLRHLVEMADGGMVSAIGVSPAKVGRLGPVLPELAAIFLSRAEASRLVADENASMDAIAAGLDRAECRRAVVTDGARPALVLEDGQVRFQAPYTVHRLSDVTGAGDTLAAVATLAFLAETPFLEAARLGMAAASLHVSADRDGRPLDLDTIRALASAMPVAISSLPDEPVSAS